MSGTWLIIVSLGGLCLVLAACIVWCHRRFLRARPHIHNDPLPADTSPIISILVETEATLRRIAESAENERERLERLRMEADIRRRSTDRPTS